MKYYIVGTAEPIYLMPLFGSKMIEREFSESDLFKNLSNMNNIHFFTSQEEASNYARSFRIKRPSKLLNPENYKFAPVIEINCDDSNTLAEINKHAEETLVVQYTHYADILTNAVETETSEVMVACRVVPKSGLDFTNLQIQSLLFPDSERPQQRFVPNQGCTLF